MNNCIPCNKKRTTSSADLSLGQKAKNVFKAFSEVVLNDAKVSDTETVRNRLLKCETCEHRKHSSMLSSRPYDDIQVYHADTCKLCGCFVTVKAQYESASGAWSCPAEKW